MLWGVILAFSVVAVLAILSLRIGRKYADQQRFPMQWDFDGQPTWSVPRGIALAVFPGLAALLMFGTIAILWVAGPERSDLPPQFLVVAIIGATFIALHVHYGYMLRRHFSR